MRRRVLGCARDQSVRARSYSVGLLSRNEDTAPREKREGILCRHIGWASSCGRGDMVQPSPDGREHRARAAEPWVASIAATANVSWCPAGTVLMRPCERVESVLLIVSGVAKQTRSDCMLVAVHRAGALLGAEAALCAASYPATVTALSSCAVARIPVATLIGQLEADPVGRTAVVRTLAQQAHDYMRAVSQLSGCPVRRRVAWILREVIKKAAVPHADGSRRLPFPLSVTEIASMAGTERETASRALSFLLKHRILVREEGRLGVPAVAPPRQVARVARINGTTIQSRGPRGGVLTAGRQE
jgi:CRP/FNR family cyclic AMP-dependent transcriptional regulator